MNAKLIQLAERRRCLIEQAESQRSALTQSAEPWRVALTRVDTGLAMLRYVKSHPLWLAAGSGTLLALLGPGRIMRWLGRGWVGLQMLSRLRI